MPAAQAVRNLSPEIGAATVGIVFLSPADAVGARVTQYGVRITPSVRHTPRERYIVAAPFGPQRINILGLTPYQEYQVDVWPRSDDGSTGPEQSIVFEAAPANPAEELQVVGVEPVKDQRSRLRVTHLDVDAGTGRL